MNRHYSTDNQTKQPTDFVSNTDGSASTSEVLVNFNDVIHSFRALNQEKKNNFTQLYIDTFWNNPLSYLTIDQHVQLFQRIGSPIIIRTSKSSNREDDGKRFDSDVESNMGETKHIEYEILHSKQKSQDITRANNSTADGFNSKQLNSRLAFRRCTTYFNH